MESEPTRSVQTERLRLPASVDALMGLVRRVLQLPSLQRLEVDTSSVTVVREVEADEPVVPPIVDGIDAEFLVDRLETEPLAGADGTHPLYRLVAATEQLRRAELIPVAILAPPRVFTAYTGLEGDDPPALLGLRILYFKTDTYDDRCVVVGGKIRDELALTSKGIIVDLES